MYSKQTGTAKATDGTEISIAVQHVDIDPKLAEKLFNLGEDVGDWGWKHKVWICAPFQAWKIQAAARYYYGWKEGSEQFTRLPNGQVRYEAIYAC